MADNLDRANTITEVKNQFFLKSIETLTLANGGGAIALGAFYTSAFEKLPRPLLEVLALIAGGYAVGVALCAVAAFLRYAAFHEIDSGNWLSVRLTAVSLLVASCAVFVVGSLFLARTMFVIAGMQPA